jgi:hypothetical protein
MSSLANPFFAGARRAVGAVAAGVVLAFPPGAAADTVVITVRSFTTYAVTQDKAPKGESNKGDRIVLRSRLTNAKAQFDKPRGAVVGSDHGTITFTNKTRIVVEGVAELPGGTIRFRGAGTFGENEPIPVVGGTGRFSGARGTLTVGEGETPLNTYRLTLPLVV